jgi:hypothetical protein
VKRLPQKLMAIEEKKLMSCMNMTDHMQANPIISALNIIGLFSFYYFQCHHGK